MRIIAMAQKAPPVIELRSLASEADTFLIALAGPGIPKVFVFHTILCSVLKLNTQKF